MTRALSLTCTALLLIGLVGSSAAAKPSIGVLGLEVVDQNGTPTPADTQAAKELSDGLRARAKAGTGPYTLAPGSDKELIDQKLLNNCDDEKPSCMSAIGNQLGAEILMYGHFEKQGKSYQVTIKVLDVSRKTVLKTSSDMIPLSEANGAALQGWARKIYAKLTGESAGSTIVVRVSNAERGTILIDGDPKGTITNGTGSVSGVGEGKVKVGVESEGFRRWEQTVTVSGGSVTVPVELERGSGGDVVGPGPGPEGPGPGPGPGEDGPKRSKLLYVGAGAGLVLTVGGLWFAYDNFYNKGPAEQDRQRKNCVYPDLNDVPTGCMPADGSAWSEDMTKKSNDKLDGYTRNARIGWGIAGVGAVVAGVSIYKLVTWDSGSSERQSARGRGKRQRKDRTFLVTPVVSPKGGGATLRVDW
jgi:hypothetical protein